MLIEELIKELEKFDPKMFVAFENGINVEEVIMDRFDGWKDKVVIKWNRHLKVIADPNCETKEVGIFAERKYWMDYARR